MSTDTDALLDEVAQREYKYGFVTDIEADTIPPGDRRVTWRTKHVG